MSKKLVEGNYAPNFIALDINGNNVQLSDFKSKKIILSFYRNVNCPFCNRRIHQLMGLNLKLKSSGVQMIFMFESSNEKLLSSVFHKGISPWPLIGDPKKLVYEKYGVENSIIKTLNTFISTNLIKAMNDVKPLQLPKDSAASDTLIPADFFINEEFKIAKAHYGNHLDDHISIETIKSFAGIR